MHLLGKQEGRKAPKVRILHLPPQRKKVMLVEIDDDVLDVAILECLKTSVLCLEMDKEGRLAGDCQYGVFHTDPIKDLKAIRKRIKALELVIEYYGG